VPSVVKPGSFNLLETFGPVQACIGIASPLPLPKTLIQCRSGTNRHKINLVAKCNNSKTQKIVPGRAMRACAGKGVEVQVTSLTSALEEDER
jgi:hypothetical protein